MFHADMYMATGFDDAIIKYLKPKGVVSATRIEPPLHPPGLEKIVKAFGMYPEDFARDDFDTYVSSLIKQNVGVTTRGIFAPWAIYKEDILAVNLHDEQFHSYHEDSDIFNRFILRGYDILQTWEAYVYHLTCRGGQFQDGVESITKDVAFHKMKHSSLLKYIRKWGNMIQNDEYHYPIIPPKYDIRIHLQNVQTVQQLEVIEPFVSAVILDSIQVRNEFIEKYSDVSHKILHVSDWNGLTDYPVDVIFNVLAGTNEDFHNIQKLNQMLKDLEESNESGTFGIGNLLIHVNLLKNTLI
jgi:hypothetical protein